MNESFPNSRTRHGTPSGWTKHKKQNEDPCPACYAAKSEYDKRRRNAPELTLKSRLSARAQMKAYSQLAHEYPEKYQTYYQAWKSRLESEDAMFDDA